VKGMTPRRKVRLVLGAGGARGVAHIGVIEELINQNFEIVEIAGCSMGAVVGGIYCTGQLEAYRNWLVRLTKLDVFMLLDFTLSAQGFVKGERVFKAVEELIGDHQIENFSIPFTAVACDLMSKQEVHYRSGSLFKALRASIAIPTILTPVTDGRKQLVDGGVLNPLPLSLIQKQADELVVAVNLNANVPARQQRFPVEENKEKNAYLKMLSAFRTQILRVDKNAEEKAERLGLFDLLNKSYDLTHDRLTELNINLYQPDIVVNISREACGIFEFYRAGEMIDEGRRAFNKAVETSKMNVS